MRVIIKTNFHYLEVELCDHEKFKDGAEYEIDSLEQLHDLLDEAWRIRPSGTAYDWIDIDLKPVKENDENYFELIITPMWEG